MKKIVLITMTIIIFFMPLSIEHQKVDAAAVVSKVVNASAKKVAKEVIKDVTFEMTTSLVMDYKYVPKEQRQPKAGFEFICFPEHKKPDGGCSQTMEIKKDLTQADKQKVSDKIETNLDKKVAGGIGATKWGKFLDWFLPIFSIGMGVAVIDYAMQGDVSDLFNELGYDTLVETGLLIPSPDIDLSGFTLNQFPSYSYYSIGHPAQVYYIDSKGVKQQATSISVVNNIALDGTFTEMELSLNKNMASTKITFDPPKTVPKTLIKGTLTHEEAWQLITLSGVMQYIKVANAPVEVPPMPKFDELNMPRVHPPGTMLKVPAPGSIPFTKTDTGEQLFPYLKPDGTIGFKTATGLEVLDPVNNVTVGSPVITENPDGSKNVKKQPTLDSPNPTPEEDGTIPKDPSQEEDPNGDKSCERLKRPNFSPLSNAITTSFPFSIPWDLMRIFNAIFGGIDDERPSFKYSFKFNGKTHVWDIEMPKMFDSWMPFVRGLLLITFDIGLIYMIYRFTRGSD